MTQVWEIVTWVLGTQVIAIAGLTARLRYQAVRKRDRQETLRELVTRPPAVDRVEVDDVREDGSRLRIRLTTTTSARAEGVESR